MMNQKMEEMKSNKKVRLKKITEIVKNSSVKTQKEIVQILKKDYKINAKQSTVSRDIKELQITKDPNKNVFVLGSKEKRNKEANSLARTLIQANAVKVEGELLSSMLVKGKPEFMPLIASQMESLFATDGISISTFIGQNGSLLLFFPKESMDSVEIILGKIFAHIEKKGAKGAE